VQVVALHVADQLAIQIQLVQVTAAVIQVVQLLAGRKGQRGQAAEWIVAVGLTRLVWPAGDQSVGTIQFAVYLLLFKLASG